MDIEAEYKGLEQCSNQSRTTGLLSQWPANDRGASVREPHLLAAIFLVCSGNQAPTSCPLLARQDVLPQ